MVQIDVDEDTKNFLLLWRSKYGTYKNALREILQENKELKSEIARLKSRISDLEFEFKEDKDDFKEIAKNLSRIQPQVGYMQPQQNYTQQLPPQMVQQTNVMLAPPPSPPKPFLDKAPELPKLSSKSKDFVKELDSKFRSGKMKPSEVCALQFKEPTFLSEEDD